MSETYYTAVLNGTSLGVGKTPEEATEEPREHGELPTGCVVYPCSEATAGAIIDSMGEVPLAIRGGWAIVAPSPAESVLFDLIEFSFSAISETQGYREALGALCRLKRQAMAVLTAEQLAELRRPVLPAPETPPFTVTEDERGPYPACPKCDEPLVLVEDVDRRYNVVNCSPGGLVLMGDATAHEIVDETDRNLRLQCPTCTTEYPLPSGGVEW